MSLKNFKTLKLTFIGGGINSSIGKMHYLSSQLDKKFILVAGCFSSNHKVNVQTAKEWNIDLDRTYKNINELVNKEKKSKYLKNSYYKSISSDIISNIIQKNQKQL